MDGTGSLPSTPLTRAVRLFLLVLVLAAVCAVSLQPDTQADHEHLVALSHADAAVQPLIRHRRALVVLQAEPRFTQNMAELSSRFHSESNGQQKRPHVQVSLQVAGRLGSWIRVGSPWTIPLSSDFMRWRSLQRHHPGKGLEDFSWHSHTFELGQHANAAAPARLSLTTNLPKPISLLLRVQELSPLGQLRNLFAMCVVLLVFGLIASEAVHRTVAAGVGCSLVLGLMALLGERPTVHQIGGWVDLDTVCLLFGMMLLVGYLSRTGVFEWSAARLFSRFGASPPTLVTALCLATALVSAFLDNVTTILLVTPVTVSLCRMLQLPPARVVICTVLCSNIGGAATIIGDPPNIMIGSQLAGQGVTFTRFAAHLAPAVLMCLAGAMLYILHALRPSLSPESKKKRVKRGGGALRVGSRQWRHTLAHDSIWQLLSTHPLREARRRDLRALPDQRGGSVEALGAGAVHGGRLLLPLVDAAAAARRRAALRRHLPRAARSEPGVRADALERRVVHPPLLWRAVHSDEGYKTCFQSLPKCRTPTFAICPKNNSKKQTPFFFGALSILMKGIAWLGLISRLGDVISHLITMAPAASRLPAALLLILWGSAIVSSLVDNVPFTAAMLPVLQRLAEGSDEGDVRLPLQPLVTALALGTCLGGNGTLVAASANVVAAGIMEGLGIPLSFRGFVRLGAPTVVVTITIASVYVIVVYVLLGWH